MSSVSSTNTLSSSAAYEASRLPSSDLLCPQCGLLLSEAVLTPCCGVDVCHACAVDKLVVDKRCIWGEKCKDNQLLIKDLIPHRAHRKKVDEFVRDNPRYANHKRDKMELDLKRETVDFVMYDEEDEDEDDGQEEEEEEEEEEDLEGVSLLHQYKSDVVKKTKSLPPLSKIFLPATATKFCSGGEPSSSCAESLVWSPAASTSSGHSQDPKWEKTGYEMAAPNSLFDPIRAVTSAATICHLCGIRNMHETISCPQIRDVVCSACGSTGHASVRCPKLGLGGGHALPVARNKKKAPPSATVTSGTQLLVVKKEEEEEVIVLEDSSDDKEKIRKNVEDTEEEKKKKKKKSKKKKKKERKEKEKEENKKLKETMAKMQKEVENLAKQNAKLQADQAKECSSEQRKALADFAKLLNSSTSSSSSSESESDSDTRRKKRRMSSSPSPPPIVKKSKPIVWSENRNSSSPPRPSNRSGSKRPERSPKRVRTRRSRSQDRRPRRDSSSSSSRSPSPTAPKKSKPSPSAAASDNTGKIGLCSKRGGCAYDKTVDCQKCPKFSLIADESLTILYSSASKSEFIIKARIELRIGSLKKENLAFGFVKAFERKTDYAAGKLHQSVLRVVVEPNTVLVAMECNGQNVDIAKGHIIGHCQRLNAFQKSQCMKYYQNATSLVNLAKGENPVLKHRNLPVKRKVDVVYPGKFRRCDPLVMLPFNDSLSPVDVVLSKGNNDSTIDVALFVVVKSSVSMMTGKRPIGVLCHILGLQSISMYAKGLIKAKSISEGENPPKSTLAGDGSKSESGNKTVESSNDGASISLKKVSNQPKVAFEIAMPGKTKSVGSVSSQAKNSTQIATNATSRKVTISEPVTTVKSLVLLSKIDTSLIRKSGPYLLKLSDLSSAANPMSVRVNLKPGFIAAETLPVFNGGTSCLVSYNHNVNFPAPKVGSIVGTWEEMVKDVAPRSCSCNGHEFKSLVSVPLSGKSSKVSVFCEDTDCACFKYSHGCAIMSTASGLSAYVLYKMTFDAELKVTVHIPPPRKHFRLEMGEVVFKAKCINGKVEEKKLREHISAASVVSVVETYGAFSRRVTTDNELVLLSKIETTLERKSGPYLLKLAGVSSVTPPKAINVKLNMLGFVAADTLAVFDGTCCLVSYYPDANPILFNAPMVGSAVGTWKEADDSAAPRTCSCKGHEFKSSWTTVLQGHKSWRQKVTVYSEDTDCPCFQDAHGCAIVSSDESLSVADDEKKMAFDAKLRVHVVASKQLRLEKGDVVFKASCLHNEVGEKKLREKKTTAA